MIPQLVSQNFSGKNDTKKQQQKTLSLIKENRGYV
jgi:hypothetical protein